MMMMSKWNKFVNWSHRPATASAESKSRESCKPKAIVGLVFVVVAVVCTTYADVLLYEVDTKEMNEQTNELYFEGGGGMKESRRGNVRATGLTASIHLLISIIRV